MFARTFIRIKNYLKNKKIKSIENELSMVQLKYFKIWSEILKSPEYHLLNQNEKIAISTRDHHMILNCYDGLNISKLFIYDKRDSKNICVEIPFNKKGTVELIRLWEEEMTHRFKMMTIEEKNMQISI